MTNDRAPLGARIAEVMGWVPMEEHPSLYVEPFPSGKAWPVTEIVSWEGYGIVDAWMREQGYHREAFHGANRNRVVVSYWKHWRGPQFSAENFDGDEPLAALQAALKAIEGGINDE